MNRNESDWINALNATTSLANTLSRTKATGLQIQNAEDERDRLNRERQGESWAYDYEQMNKGLPGADRVAPENFTRSGDTNIGLPEKTRGLATAVTTQNVVDDANLKKMVMQYKNKFSQIGFDELSKLDTTTLGPDALPARIAQGYMFDEMGKSEQGMAMKNKARSENIANLYGQFKAGLSQYKDLMRSGDKKSAAGVLVNVINRGNALPHKAMETEDGKIRLYLTTEGNDNHDTKAYTPDEMYDYLNGISKKEYFVQNYLSAEAADALRRQSFAAPSVVSNGSEQLRVVAFPGKNGESYRIEAYGPNGKVEGIDSWQQLYAKGFNPVAKNGQAGGRNLDVNGLKYQKEQARDAFIVDAMNKNLPFTVDQGGNIVTTEPLTTKQWLEAKAIAKNRGINIGWNKSETGGFMGFGKSDIYQPGAYSYQPGARGLQIDSPGETDLTNIGGKSKEKLEEEKAALKPIDQTGLIPESFTNYMDSKFSGKMDPVYKQRIAELIYSGSPKPDGLPDEDWNAVREELIYLEGLSKTKAVGKPSTNMGLTLSDDYMRKRNTYNIAGGM